ncbi:O-Antigen ligase [Rathayibacter oskolensis]|uniref:O-Antigen ligase n=1 Tax=Rathayibacter oskolensis TaxID=1891671 RepID=A0A1X7NAP2_9MICO|nr:O-antigen ligase family protein [Rathayibacter oskolensis]SMH34681.1 O-Antigen ligase [Rathayibacter oskolensis]
MKPQARSGGLQVHSGRKSLTLAELCLFLTVAFVPFQQVFTVSVGFPLKLSEIFAGLGCFFCVVGGARARSSFAGWPLLAVFTVIIGASTLIAALTPLPVASAPGYSLGFTLDLLQYTAYAILVIATAYLMATRIGADVIVRATSVAVRLAALYALVQIGLWLAGSSSVLAIVNGNIQFGRAFGTNLPRNGSFLEGNYLGFFAAFAFFTSLRGATVRRRTVDCFLAVALLLYSQSTSALAGLIVGIGVMLILRPDVRAGTALVGSVIPILGLAFAFVPSVTAYADHQLGKLGLGPAAAAGDSISYSSRTRTLNADAGIGMGWDHAGAGVGAGRFGVYQPSYADFSTVPAGYSSGIRPITPSAFVQIFAEHGLFAFLAFTLLLVALAWRVRRINRLDFALAVFLFVGLNATPSWTVMTIWIAIAYLAARAGEGRTPSSEPLTSMSARPERSNRVTRGSSVRNSRPRSLAASQHRPT